MCFQIYVRPKILLKSDPPDLDLDLALDLVLDLALDLALDLDLVLDLALDLALDFPPPTLVVGLLVEPVPVTDFPKTSNIVPNGEPPPLDLLLLRPPIEVVVVLNPELEGSSSSPPVR